MRLWKGTASTGRVKVLTACAIVEEVLNAGTTVEERRFQRRVSRLKLTKALAPVAPNLAYETRRDFLRCNSYLIVVRHRLDPG